MTKDWQEEKKVYLEKLKNVNFTIKSFLDKDIGGFINNDIKEKLTNCHKKAETYQQKLEKDIFEIAIVGEENSGKSSFANALISSYAFPSAFRRCTYTTTQLEYGDNKTIVEFHSRESFNNIFQAMLRDIEYPKYESVYFDSLSLSNLDQHLLVLQSENPNLYKVHNSGNTFDDIKAMIKGSSTIGEYLNKGIKSFDDHTTNEIKTYITDEYISRAVKKIIIKSSELKDLQNAIVFDVPGFTSPTKIHKEQTIERLKTVDAIILIHNLINVSNLSGPQLEVFSDMDIDNVRLKEKLFIFGTKIDFHDTEEGREDCIREFKNDIFKRDLASEDRVFAGSSGAYLAKNNIPLDEKNNSETVKKLKEFKYDDCIEKLKEKLKMYYKNERFEILKRRIDSVINEVKIVCNDFIENQELNISHFDSKFFSSELIIKIINDCKIFLLKELTDLRKNIIEEIDSSRFLSKKLSEAIDSSFSDISENDYQDMVNFMKIDTNNILSPEAVNMRLREQLTNKFKVEFEDLVTDIANEKYKEFSDKLLDKFLISLSLEASNPYYKEVKEYSLKFLNKIFEKSSYQPTSFIFLAERFSIDILEILILHSLFSTGRKAKFIASEQNFYSLALFHTNKLKEQAIYYHPLIKLILTQKYIPNTPDNNVKNIKNSLIDELKKIPDFLEVSHIYDKNIMKYATIIATTALGFNATSFVISKLLEKISEKGVNQLSKNDEIESLISSSLNTYSMQNNNKEDPKNLYIESLIKEAKRAETIEDVITEINTDINNFKSILKDSVVAAIELEKPFKSIVTKQIDSLKSKIIPYDSTIDNDFKDLIIQNISFIKYKDFSTIAEQEAINENKKTIIRDMKSLLTSLS